MEERASINFGLTALLLLFCRSCQPGGVRYVGPNSTDPPTHDWPTQFADSQSIQISTRLRTSSFFLGHSHQAKCFYSSLQSKDCIQHFDETHLSVRFLSLGRPCLCDRFLHLMINLVFGRPHDSVLCISSVCCRTSITTVSGMALSAHVALQ